MERLTEQIKNKETGEILTYRLHTEIDRIRAYRKLGELEDLEEKGKLFGIWIPCSERLPKIGEKVLTCREGMSEQIVVDSYEVWTDDFGIFRKEWDHGGECVTAWMPLPEPYKGE